MITLKKVPDATQELAELPGNGASQRILRKFIELSYVKLDPERRAEDSEKPNTSLKVEYQKKSQSSI